MSWPKSIRPVFDLRPLRFVAVGLANTGLGLAMIYFSKLILHFGDIAANATGYAVGLTIAFSLNSTWTFEYGGRTVAAAGRFLTAFVVSYGANLLAVWLLIDAGDVNSYVAQAVGVVPYTACFYVLCRSFVFGTGRARPMPQGGYDLDPPE